MPAPLLSQLATRYNLNAPKFNVTDAVSSEDMQNLIRFNQEQESRANLKSFSSLAAQGKMQEGKDEINAKLQAQLATLKQLRSKELDGQPNAVALDQQIAKVQQNIAEVEAGTSPLLRKYTVDAARILVSPDMAKGAQNQKNVQAMAEAQAAIDNKYIEINDLLKGIDKKPLADQENISQKVKQLKAEAIELGRQYTIASQGSTYRSPYDNDYYQEANAIKNLEQAAQSKMQTGKMASEINSKITDDATNAVKTWSSENREAVKNVKELRKQMHAFDFLYADLNKNPANTTPANFAALVKVVNKMILPGEAVMADDAKMMAQYGGGESNFISGMAMMGQQIATAFESAKKAAGVAITKAATEVESGVGKAWEAGKSTVLGTDSTATAPTQTEQEVTSNTKRSMKNLYEDVQAPINTKYIGQTQNILDLGKKYRDLSEKVITVFEKSLQNMIVSMDKYLVFRNAQAYAAANGGADLTAYLQSPEGKQVLDVAINQAIDSELRPILGDGSVVSTETQEAPVAAPSTPKQTATVPAPTKTTETKKTTTSSTKSKAEREKYEAEQRKKREAKTNEKKKLDAKTKAKAEANAKVDESKSNAKQETKRKAGW